MGTTRELTTIRVGDDPQQADTVSSPSDAPPGGSPPSLPSAFDPPSVRFEAKQELGRGGMGRVVAAFDRALGRSVAVKTMISASALDLARFEREAQITAGLEHPGIVPVHDVGRDEYGTPYYVMRKVDGLPLHKLVDDRPLGERLALIPNLLAACDAMAYAHARGIIHRDLKPTNILVGPFGETLVIDWGLARAIGAEGATTSGAGRETTDPDRALTRAGTVAGTPGFMAPEQARGDHVDARADVYALGATLFYVLSGTLGLEGPSPTEMIARVSRDESADWSRLPRELPSDLRAIVIKAMASRKGDRYPDAGALAADLRRYVTGKLVIAHRYGRLEQLRRFAGRHRAALAVAAVALIVVVAGGLLSVRRILEERDDAVAAHARANTQSRENAELRDVYLVRHARDLADTDPARAIAVLRTLGPASTQWPAAAVAAAAAHARGIPFGFAFGGRIRSFVLSPSGDLVLVRMLDSDAAWLVNLRTRSRRFLGPRLSTRVSEWEWLDHDRWVVVASDGAVMLMDTMTGASRTLPYLGHVGSLASDRRSTVYLKTREGAVYRIEVSTPSLDRPLVTDVTELATDARDGLVFLRAGRVVLRVGDTERELPGPSPSVTSRRNLIAGAHMAMLTGDVETCVWTLAPVAAQLFCRALRQPIALSRGGVITYAAGAVSIATATGDRQLRTGNVALIIPSTTAVAVATQEGELWIDTADTWIEVGRQSVELRRLAVGDDSHWAVAEVAGHELLAFDLTALHPALLLESTNHSIVSLTEHALWTREGSEGGYRHDRRTRTSEPVSTDALHWLTVGPDERYVLLERLGRAPQVLSGPARRALQLPQGAIVYADTDVPIAVDRTGTVLVLAGDGTTHHTKLGTFPAQPALLAAAADYLVGTLADGRACRLYRPSGHTECIALATVASAVLVLPSGAVWIASGTTVWRWEGGLVTPFVEPQPVTQLVASHEHVVAVAWTVAIVHDGLATRVLAIPSFRRLVVLDHDRLAFVLSNLRLAVFDLISGMHYERYLRPLDTDAIASDGSSVAVVQSQHQGRAIAIAEFPVPVEQAALQRWLGTVTNAVAVPGSDAIAWP